MAITISNLSPSGTLNPSVETTFTWSVAGGIQSHYEFKYRLRGIKTWTGTGKIESSARQHKISADVLRRNRHYEFKVRVWITTTAQSPWSYVEAVASELPAISHIAGIGSNQARIVALGASEKPPSIRVKLPQDIVGEFDLVETGEISESGLRVKVDETTVRGVAKKLSDYYADYSDHSDSGYTVYSNHSNTGSGAYSNHSNGGYTAYSNHTNTTYSRYYDWVNSGYSAYSNWTNTGYSRYYDYEQGYNPTGYRVYNNHTNSGYSRYSNHTNTGYPIHYSDNDVNIGYSAYSDHGNSGYSVYTNHTNSGYIAYVNHTDNVI